MSNDHWNTPPEIRDLCVEVLGRLDFDPCSNSTSVLGAAMEITEELDGLAVRWSNYGRTALVNPPYSNAAAWLERCAVESESLDLIALVNVGTATNYWHESVWPNAAAVCFPKGRIAFLKDGEPVKGNRYEQALVLYSDSRAVLERFITTFSQIGAVVLIAKEEAA